MSTIQDEPYFPEALRASREESLLADLEFHWLPAEELPEPAKSLLVHDRDMTTAQESYYHEPLKLQVLKSTRDGEVYCREVILRTAESDKPVEYGLIDIELEAFPEEIVPAILAGEKPLGGILNDAGINYGSSPLGFFSLPAEKFREVFPDAPDGSLLYGRYNQLSLDNGALMARIIEILPCLDAS